MLGVITNWDILAHPLVTIRTFGWRIYFRALLTGRDKSFLSLLRGANFFDTTARAPAMLERSIDLELRAKRIYSAFAKAFDQWKPINKFFETLARQEQDHADLLELCRAAASRGSWKINYLNPWQAYLPRLEQQMQAAETSVYSVTSVEDALRLALQLESSEVNQIFQAILLAGDSLFVRKLLTFRRAMEDHISYITERVPQLAPQLLPDARDLLAKFPRLQR